MLSKETQQFLRNTVIGRQISDVMLTCFKRGLVDGMKDIFSSVDFINKEVHEATEKLVNTIKEVKNEN